MVTGFQLSVCCVSFSPNKKKRLPQQYIRLVNKKKTVSNLLFCGTVSVHKQIVLVFWPVWRNPEM